MHYLGPHVGNLGGRSDIEGHVSDEIPLRDGPGDINQHQDTITNRFGEEKDSLGLLRPLSLSCSDGRAGLCERQFKLQEICKLLVANWICILFMCHWQGRRFSFRYLVMTMPRPPALQYNHMCA